MATLAANALTSLADVKELLGIASSDTTKDNLIIRKINQVSSQIATYCGRVFQVGTYTDEIYNGTWVDQIVLKQRPVTSDVVLKFRDTPLNTNDFDTLESTLAFADATSGVVDLNFKAVGHWGRYAATYTAGYTTIPADLAEAAATLAAYFTQNPSGAQVGVNEKQEGQRRVRYGATNNADLSFTNILRQLGLDETIAAYSNYPINADK